MSLIQNEIIEESAKEAQEESEQNQWRIKEEIDWLFRQKDYSNVPHGSHNQGIAYRGDRP